MHAIHKWCNPRPYVLHVSGLPAKERIQYCSLHPFRNTERRLDVISSRWQCNDIIGSSTPITTHWCKTQNMCLVLIKTPWAAVCMDMDFSFPYPYFAHLPHLICHSACIVCRWDDITLEHWYMCEPSCCMCVHTITLSYYIKLSINDAYTQPPLQGVCYTHESLFSFSLPSHFGPLRSETIYPNRECLVVLLRWNVSVRTRFSLRQLRASFRGSSTDLIS